MTWHVDELTFHRYLSDEMDVVAASSIEAHVSSCAECRARIPADSEGLERSWARIREAVEVPEVGWFERLLRTAGVRPDVARLLAVTPGLRAAWLVALTVAMGFGLLGAAVTDSSLVDGWFLAVAPLVPMAGVLLGFSSMADPAHELGLAVPMDRFWLTMLRSALVAGSAFIILLGVDLLTGDTSGAWLVPAVAATLLALALAPHVGPVGATVTVSVSWMAIVWLLGDGMAAVWAGPGQPAAVAAALAAAAVIALERDRFRRGEVWL